MIFFRQAGFQDFKALRSRVLDLFADIDIYCTLNLSGKMIWEPQGKYQLIKYKELKRNYDYGIIWKRNSKAGLSGNFMKRNYTATPNEEVL